MDIKVMCALLSLIEGTRIHVLGSGAVESVIVTIDHNIEVTCSKNFWYFFPRSWFQLFIIIVLQRLGHTLYRHTQRCDKHFRLFRQKKE